MSVPVIHIFTHFGCTYTFLKCNIICDNESILQFSYVAMSDGSTKMATFPKRNFCGWTISSS